MGITQLQDEMFRYKYGVSDSVNIGSADTDTLVHDTASGAVFFLRELTIRNNAADTAIIQLKDASGGTVMWRGSVFPAEMIFLTFSAGIKFNNKDAYGRSSQADVDISVSGIEK